MENGTLQVFDGFINHLHEIQLTFIIVEVIIGSTTIIGSSLVLALYYQESKKSSVSKKISHKYFVALTVADLVQGVIVPPLAIFVSFGIRTNDRFCLESMAIAVTTIFISLFLMVGMSFDRYLAITSPLKYIQLSVNGYVTYGVIVGSWIGGVVVGVCLYYTADISQNPQTLCFVHTERTSVIFNIFSVMLIIVPSILLFLFIYSRIYMIIRKAIAHDSSSLKKLGRRIVLRKNTNKNLETTIGGIKMREIRSTLILFITIVLFLLSWVPGIILLIILRIFPKASSLNGTYALAQLNSMINPLLYARNIKNAGFIIKGWVLCGCLKENGEEKSSSS